MRSRIFDRIGEQVFYENLENGLKVFIVKKPDFNKTLAFFATNYGGADRRFKIGGQWIDTPSGVAHFLEHKMFDMENGNALTLLTEKGASANAFTSSGMTAYHFTCTDNFEENFKLLLEFVSTPYFTQESVDKEQGIIGQEIKMTEDNPDFVLYYNLLKALFATHPVRDSVAGTVESIAEISAQTLYDCHKIFYNPSNMVLCVVGNVDENAVVKMAKDMLPKLPGEIPEIDYGKAETAYPNSDKIEVCMEVGLPLFLIGSKVVCTKSGRGALKQELVGNLAVNYIAGTSSPLYTKMYAEGLINSNFSVEFESVAGVAYTAMGGESKEPEKVKFEIENTIKETLANGIDNEQFIRLKKAATGAQIRGLNSFDNICYNVADGYFKGYEFFDTVSVLDEITAQDVLEFIKENLIPEKIAISIVKSSVNLAD